MEVFATWVWMLQAVFLGAGALVVFIAPGLVTSELGDSGATAPIAIALTRMLVPTQGSLALFSAYAAMRQNVGTRRALAATFALVFALWLVTRAAWTDLTTAHPVTRGVVVTVTVDAALLTLALVNAAYALHRPGMSLLLGTLVARRRAAYVLALGALVYAALRVSWPLPDALRAWHGGALLEGGGEAFRVAMAVLRAHGVLLFGLAFAAVTMAYAIRKEDRASLAAVTSTMPPRLWALWVLQFAAFFAVGIALLVHPAWSLGLIVSASHQGDATEALMGIATRAGPIYLGLAIATRVGIAETSADQWRTFARIHAATAALQIVAGFFAWQPGFFRAPTALFALAAFAAFGARNRALVAKASEASAQEVGEGPDGWTLMDLATGPALTIQSLSTRRRGTHLRGVAAEGTFTALESQFDRAPRCGHARRALPRPAHQLFETGSTFRVQARFSTVTYQDDASCDVRGAAIKVIYDEARSRSFDMLMNTGAISAVDNLKSFAALILLKFFPEGLKEALFKKSRPGIEAGVSGFRQAPSSFARLNYYSQNVRHWVDRRDVRWLVRYRLVPCVPVERADAAPLYRILRKEAGVPDERRRLEIWKRARSPDDDRPRDYLRRELRQRIEAGPVSFVFQAQFHRPERGDTLDWYNAGVDWPVLKHPWHDVGLVELTRPLPDAETERLCFNTANHPVTLGVPIASDWTDFRSMADSERRILRRLQGLRSWLYDNLGLPGEGDR